MLQHLQADRHTELLVKLLRGQALLQLIDELLLLLLYLYQKLLK